MFCCLTAPWAPIMPPGTPMGRNAASGANISAPADILEIHRAYLAAGCKAIKTNTFAVNRPALGEADCVCLLEAGYGLAREAVGASAFVFADIGPISAPDPENLFAEYQFVVDRFLELGADHFLFETHSQDTCLHRIAAYLKKQRPEVFILVSFAAQPDGFTRAGVSAAALIHRAEADENIDAVGLNCISGAKHMAALVEALGPIPKPLSAMPNAGYPTVLGSRTFYHGDPAYFALQLSELQPGGRVFWAAAAAPLRRILPRWPRRWDRPAPSLSS